MCVCVSTIVSMSFVVRVTSVPVCWDLCLTLDTGGNDVNDDDDDNDSMRNAGNDFFGKHVFGGLFSLVRLSLLWVR